VFDSGSTGGGTPFFVMELLSGVTLRNHMDRGPVDPREATGIMTQVLSGLGAAHAKGVIHRDIKPENVFLQEREGLEPVAKILDFGLAKLPGPYAKVNTAKGVALGTVLYMAPEQLRGLPVSVACDVYATALVLYEAIAGKHPFRASSHAETAAHILRTIPAPLEMIDHACPPALGAAVAKGLAKDPAARFSSAREFQAALHRALQIVERPQGPPPRTAGKTGLPNLASSDSDHESDGTTTQRQADETGKTIPNEIYRRR
jgi:serine/threonine-protein kinase